VPGQKEQHRPHRGGTAGDQKPPGRRVHHAEHQVAPEKARHNTREQHGGSAAARPLVLETQPDRARRQPTGKAHAHRGHRPELVGFAVVDDTHESTLRIMRLDRRFGEEIDAAPAARRHHHDRTDDLKDHTGGLTEGPR